MKDAFADLWRRAEADEDLRAALGSATSDPDLIRVAGEWGIALSVDDLRPSGELADADLEGVAGGTNAAWYWATAPEFCSTAGRLCTFYAPYCTPQ